MRVPFAAGIIHENDIEFPVASALASELITEKAFEAVSQESYEKALKLMKKCSSVICAAERFGAMNERCHMLLEEAGKVGLLRKEY